ncbi:M20/M25/M40 family metallo-hydrolase [Deinococcus humi]|uniref:Arginine utilization protein RocB n=1 Tax=Deinococcus humi TaxID=662880 RepID=A0A7W8JXD2_9DEIO|nr:M20/M25/M40 family metallo-hydrolase [Deinococcus humi]MBB5363678.1 arginine utilization protein RocB [Deinococcus humi]GGO29810.1 peptidase M20 [Deinococcus humi]
MTERSPWFDRTQDLALTLTRWPSVTGTPDEAAFGPRLRDFLARWPYFEAHPEHLWLSPIPGSDALNVFALVAGTEPDTVVLSGHYDTVSTAPYGELQPLATEPHTLLRALLAQLDREDLTAAEAQARADLRSGDFLPGRGLLDMKAGLAAGLAVLERYAACAAGERRSHLLLIASPDEEGASSGARHVAHLLPDLMGARNLHVRLGLNLDATNAAEDGQDGRTIYLGTVGKLLVSALVVGRPTHAGYPFDGTSAALMAAELVRRIEGHPDLADHAHGAAAPPPICLTMQDDRTRYDVTTPAAVWCAFNVLTHRRSPAEVLSQFEALAHEAADAALSTFRNRAEGAASPSAPGLADQRARILTVAELRALAVMRRGAAQVSALEAATPPGPDPLQASRHLTQGLLSLAGLEGPLIVLGFGGVHYPHAHVGDAPDGDDMRAWVEQQRAAFARQAGQTIGVRPYFAGISDISFFGQVPSAGTRDVVVRQTVHPAHCSPQREDALRFPVLNVGPWGRDYHQKLERVHQPYAFDTLPRLLWHLSVAAFPKRSRGPSEREGALLELHS